MWKGKITEKLRSLAKQYADRFGGVLVDGYDDLAYNLLTYRGVVQI